MGIGVAPTARSRRSARSCTAASYLNAALRVEHAVDHDPELAPGILMHRWPSVDQVAFAAVPQCAVPAADHAVVATRRTAPVNRVFERVDQRPDLSGA